MSEDDKLEFHLTEFDRQVYRKYIEDVLKTRGLRKSLNFLERLHTSVLRKARLALEKSKNLPEESTILQEEYEGDQELRRYGVWSPEAKDLNLPSYRYINLKRHIITKNIKLFMIIFTNTFLFLEQRLFSYPGYRLM